MRRVMELPAGWELQTDDEARPLLVHKDGRRLEPKAFAQEGCAQEIYVALKLEEDKVGRLRPDHERTAEFMAIWSARAVLGYFIRQVKKDQRILREEARQKIEGPEVDGDEPPEVAEDIQVLDLRGNVVQVGPAIPQDADEDPEEFLDKELDALARVQQRERAQLW
jgi:hypothetical protein